MLILQQSTATAILLGPFLDETDGKTPETSLTVASVDVDVYKFSNTHALTKTDITPAASGSSNDMAHVANGYYSFELTASNTDTLGRLRVTANISGAQPVWEDFMVEADPTIAGSVLAMNFASVVSEASRSLLNAARFLRNRWTIGDDSGNLIVYEEDDSTQAWASTGGVTRTTSYDPVTEIDPD